MNFCRTEAKMSFFPFYCNSVGNYFITVRGKLLIWEMRETACNFIISYFRYLKIQTCNNNFFLSIMLITIYFSIIQTHVLLSLIYHNAEGMIFWHQLSKVYSRPGKSGTRMSIIFTINVACMCVSCGAYSNCGRLFVSITANQH